MQAEIVGEDDKGLGVDIVDNNGAEHHVGMNFEGEIKFHQCDAYADKAANRTDNENEHNAQARRFARYHVYRERGYQTLDAWEIPESILLTAGVIDRLTQEEFEEHFGAYYQQFRSTVEDDVEPVVEPVEEKADGLSVYLQYVSLDVDLVDVLTTEECEALEQSLAEETDPGALFDQLGDAVESLDLADFSIVNTSELGTLYQTHTDEVENPPFYPDHVSPDARLELSPIDPPWKEYLPPEGFQTLVVHHLLCQVRDCYLRMGLEPPEGVRVLGLGKYRQTVRSEHLGCYEPVHYTDSPVEGYRLPKLGTHLEQ
ncbi:hypothetical protein [Natranaeroarchaeum aerophilus]|uniref:Uncharacterized protein n=1 Tax=Natranaeroarchaeum aerophilus TaxID=2917711 RepID=A0AAE3FN24_9EURY|nr:hypothetical protein [Natranaeroarchaeum aerophilus]MCL9812041.1 hypothetical protein [Natranaeroarchaeum aerophilus]